MRFIAMIFAAGVLACTAHAQFGRVEKSQDEMAFEKAVSSQAEHREKRAEAIRSCSQMDFAACFTLGEFYRRGVGGLQDYEKSATAYRKSCSGGDGQGCAGLAYLFNDGKGVEIDYAQARLYYKKACDLGEISGCAGYGNLLYVGKGGIRQVNEGTKYLRNACDQEYDWACQRIIDLGAFDPKDDTYERLKEWKTRNF
ncbi:MAG: tetratricopeptide repeat protein [Hyphomonas sp.]